MIPEIALHINSMKRITYIWVDPPSGWKFGFPKSIDKEKYTFANFSLLKWLVDNGYPQGLIDELGENFTVRCWETEEK